MKKRNFLLFVLLFITTSLSAQFNEDYLVGKWVLSSESDIKDLVFKDQNNKGNSFIMAPDSIIFYNDTTKIYNQDIYWGAYNYHTDAWRDGTTRDIIDYSITNSNLHIIFSKGAMVFRIISLEEDILIMKSRNGKGYLKYIKETMQMPSSTRSLSLTTNKKYYSIDGQMSETPSGDGFLIENSSKDSRKLYIR